jgi:PBP1b-binding outer membrane lipoprotein LpoB
MKYQMLLIAGFALGIAGCAEKEQAAVEEAAEAQATPRSRSGEPKRS